MIYGTGVTDVETVRCDLWNRWNRRETVRCDLWDRCETVRSFSAQNVRKSICRKGFQAVCARGVAQMLLCTHQKQPHSPTYIEIYLHVMYFLFFKGVLTYARVAEYGVTCVKKYIYII